MRAEITQAIQDSLPDKESGGPWVRVSYRMMMADNTAAAVVKVIADNREEAIDIVLGVTEDRLWTPRDMAWAMVAWVTGSCGNHHKDGCDVFGCKGDS